MIQTLIKKGKAIITQTGLRCQGPRAKEPATPCNKLLVKKNQVNQIAGWFRCERCGQDVEVEIQVK